MIVCLGASPTGKTRAYVRGFTWARWTARARARTSTPESTTPVRHTSALSNLEYIIYLNLLVIATALNLLRHCFEPIS